MISSRIILRYIYFQIPALVVLVIVLLFIKKTIYVPTWAIIVIFVSWIVKDIIMFPKVWRSYDTKKSGHEERLIGVKGVVVDELNPEGFVKIKGELWRAEIEGTNTSVKKGEEIKVIRVENMKLIVDNFSNS